MSSPVRLDIALRKASLGQPTSGLDHLHVSLDGGQPMAFYDATDVTLPRVPPGPHALVVELAGPDHRPLPPVKSVSFTVAS